MNNNHIIDLTESNSGNIIVHKNTTIISNKMNENPKKQRILPQTILNTSSMVPTKNMIPASRSFKPHYNAHQIVNKSSYNNNKPANTINYLINTQNNEFRNTAPQILLRNNHSHRILPTYQNTLANNIQSRAYVPMKATIIFSLIDTYRFSIKSHMTGTVDNELLNMLYSIEGSKFDWQTCQWQFPLVVHDNLQVALAQYGHKVEALPRETIAAAQLKNQRDSCENPAESLLNLKGSIPDSVLHCLAPFQRDAVLFVLRNKGRALIADEMGLGKTRTAIAAAMAYCPDDWPLLIVCPSSARHHWQAEMLSILYPECIDPKDITVVENNTHPIFRGSRYFKSKVLIISYALVSTISNSLQEIPFNVVIVDECHYLKTATAKRTQCLMPILHRSKNLILLSGTPALSRPIELFTQLHALNPIKWNSEKDYGQRYCVNPITNNRTSRKTSSSSGKGWSDFKGANNTQELHVLLTSSFMIRRLKKDILAQLPEKIRRIVKIEIQKDDVYHEMKGLLDVISQYEDLLLKRNKKNMNDQDIFSSNNDNNNNNEYRNHYEEQKDINKQSKQLLNDLKQKKKHALLRLFTLSGQAKLPVIIKKIELFLADRMAGKALIFCHHKSVMDGIVKVLTSRGDDFIRIDGQTASKDRHSRVQYFQTSSQCRIAVLSITAAGIALTLTAAATVFFAELYWTPGSLLQAEDRAHRIGQNNNVSIYYFLADNSVDELLWPLVRKKMKLLGEIVEGHTEVDIIISNNEINNNTNGNSNSFDEEMTNIGVKRIKQIEDPDLEDLNSLVDEIVVNESINNHNLNQSDDEDMDENENKIKKTNNNNHNNMDNDDNDDDESVECIESPDQLALLYMNMYSAYKENSTTNNQNCNNVKDMNKESIIKHNSLYNSSTSIQPISMLPLPLYSNNNLFTTNNYSNMQSNINNNNNQIHSNNNNQIYSNSNNQIYNDVNNMYYNAYTSVNNNIQDNNSYESIQNNTYNYIGNYLNNISKINEYNGSTNITIQNNQKIREVIEIISDDSIDTVDSECYILDDNQNYSIQSNNTMLLSHTIEDKYRLSNIKDDVNSTTNNNSNNDINPYSIYPLTGIDEQQIKIIHPANKIKFVPSLNKIKDNMINSRHSSSSSLDKITDNNINNNKIIKTTTADTHTNKNENLVSDNNNKTLTISMNCDNNGSNNNNENHSNNNNNSNNKIEAISDIFLNNIITSTSNEMMMKEKKQINTLNNDSKIEISNYHLHNDNNSNNELIMNQNNKFDCPNVVISTIPTPVVQLHDVLPMLLSSPLFSKLKK